VHVAARGTLLLADQQTAGTFWREPDATDVSVDLDLPSGWTAKPVGATHFDRLAAGTSARLPWQ
jgi:hypothetical protein